MSENNEYYDYEEYIDSNENEPQNEDQYQETIHFKRQYSKTFIFVRLDEMEKLRNKIIDECMEFTYTNRSEAILIMIYFQWNLNGFKDVWYNNPDNYRILCGIDQSKESKIEVNKKFGNIINDCYICDINLKTLQYINYEDIKTTTILSKYYTSLSCNHKFCLECWNEYLNSKIDDQLSLLATTCAMKDCNLIIPEIFFYNIIRSENFMKLKTSILKNFTDKNKEMKWCPFPNCGLCVRSIVFNKEIDCECGNTFCFNCGKEGHRPCTCEMITAWETKNTSESENVAWLIANTKQCPTCKKFIEKNQGCNHMTCNKSIGGCGYEFCWICLGDWKEHKKDYYNCNAFDTKKFEKKDKEIEKAKFELAKYSHYFTRYMNHSKAMTLAIKLKSEIKDIITKFINIHQIPLDEILYLNTAVETVIKARIKLKNTYVFGFYMLDCTEKNLFEHQQKILENEADLLHEYLEGNELLDILKINEFIEFRKKFDQFKVKITNLYTVSQKYMDNLINDIEISMQGLVNYKGFK